MINNIHSYVLRERGRPSTPRQVVRGQNHTQKNILHDQVKSSKTPAIYESPTEAKQPSCRTSVTGCFGVTQTTPGLVGLERMVGKGRKMAGGLRLLLVRPASTWYNKLSDDVKADTQLLDTAFQERLVHEQPTMRPGPGTAVCCCGRWYNMPHWRPGRLCIRHRHSVCATWEVKRGPHHACALWRVSHPHCGLL